MPRTISIGTQDFEKLVGNHYFYIDKTYFISDWYRSGDDITLITRPRRFGKTLTLSMMNRFFSRQYQGKADLFDGLKVAEDLEIMKRQGMFPVISLSFANIKEQSFEEFIKQLSAIIRRAYRSLFPDTDLKNVSEVNGNYIRLILDEKMDLNGEIIPLSENILINSLNRLSEIMEEAYGQKVFIFLDEYDTPLQEAYVNGYWKKASGFIRSLFHNTFKTNTSLDRAILTGITRISKESIFSDLNNLETATVLDDKYVDVFGFTEQEVKEALIEYGLTNQFENVRFWYDGFSCGKRKNIYNPWSITKYLDNQKFELYWANTSSDALVSHLILTGGSKVKQQFEALVNGEVIRTKLNQEIIFERLGKVPDAVWGLLLATGYLKQKEYKDGLSTLAVTNYEVSQTFASMVEDWFSDDSGNYDGMISALLKGNLDAMNDYMNEISRAVFGMFDTATKPSEKRPENFYHGFVLGLIIRLQGRYAIHSNAESGYGRYDITLEPLKEMDDGIIIEFKVFDPKTEKTLADTVQRALAQIDEQRYDQMLLEKHISKDRIRKYGFAFKGKNVLIGQ